MNIPRLLFALLVLMAATVVPLFVIEEVPGGRGFDHPDYEPRTIQQAPASVERHRSVIWFAGSFGALVALFSAGSMALGLTESHREGTGAKTLLAAGVTYSILLVSTVYLYWKFANAPDVTIFGFPVATAWMLFIFGPSPLVLVLVYMVTFRRWILRPHDMDVFHGLVAARRERQTD